MLVVCILMSLLLSHALPPLAAAEPPAPACAARISAEQAVALAVSDLAPTADGLRLDHPRHEAFFAPDGVTFRPRGGGPQWRWQLESLSLGDGSAFPTRCDSVLPQSTDARQVRYRRGSIEERYLLKTDCIEQQFVVSAPLERPDGDLIIVGTVSSGGSFEEHERGWMWRDARGVVSLGRVHVYDACGTTLPATMDVTAGDTRIVVAGEVLSRAAFPVTIDPEIGSNDFRLSDMGPDGDIDYDAHSVAVAYNPNANEYLVVWEGDDDVGTLVEGEFEIFGQRVSAATGAELGTNDFRISDMGPDGDHSYDAVTPAVAFDPARSQYLVVWSGEDNLPGLAIGEFEIFGQLLDALGQPVGNNDFRISDIGPDGDALYDAQRPAVVFSSDENEYLVVWEGDDNTGILAEGESEIFGQRIDAATGAEVGSNDFRISDMGVDGDPSSDANSPAAAYNAQTNEYLVVWEGDDQTYPLMDGETEIYGQRLSAATGAQLGSNDFRLSDMGPDGSELYDADSPAVAYNGDRNEYLVVWEGDDDVYPLIDGETEIFGQRVSATGSQIGSNDFRISDMGPDGDADYDAVAPAVVYCGDTNEYLAVWEGDDESATYGDDEFEAFAQRIDGATGVSVGTNDFRLSDMGTDGDATYDARRPAVVCGSAVSEYLVVWSGDDDTGELGDQEFEAYGQRVTASTGMEVGTNDQRLSDMGSTGDLDYDAYSPAVAYSPLHNEYLVVWSGDDDVGTLVDGEFEILGQRIDAGSGLPVGSNDFRISDMGPNSDISYDAQAPAVAYNSHDDEYLVVWEGEDDGGLLVQGEFEIFGQRINAATGGEVGSNDFRISDMGTDGITFYDASDPDVAYDPVHNQYLVVWEGDDNTYPLVDGEWEIFGQRIDAATGSEVGANDFRISDMGVDGDAGFDAGSPAVVYNGTVSEYLVVWAGEDGDEGEGIGEYEIFGQRISAATGSQLGTNDFRISDMGPDGDGVYDAFAPAVAFNSGGNEYLVVWEGDDSVYPLVDDEFEIFGQRLSGSTGLPIGSNDFRISQAGPDGNVLYDARDPAVAYDSAQHEYLVVWQADTDAEGLINGEYEIYGQLLDAATGFETGEDDFRLSDMGVDGDPYADARCTAITYDIHRNRYLVVWEGDDVDGPLANDEFEVYGQFFTNDWTDVADDLVAVGGLRLRVTPNPILPISAIEWQSQGPGLACLRLLNAQGRLVAARSSVIPSAGRQRLAWRDLVGQERLPSGIYFLELGDNAQMAGVRRVLLLR